MNSVTPALIPAFSPEEKVNRLLCLDPWSRQAIPAASHGFECRIYKPSPRGEGRRPGEEALREVQGFKARNFILVNSLPGARADSP